MMKVARIYVFGDSLVAGTYDSLGGWCDRLKQDMHKITAEAEDGTKRQLYNLGIGGENSRGLLQRIEQELAARHSNSWPAVIIIGTGTNDSRLRDGMPEVEIEEYEQNLRSILAVARKVTEKIILVGIGPCAEPEIPFKNYVYSHQRLVAYNDVLTRVASELNIAKVEVYKLLSESTTTVHYRDGVHLSDHGYSLIHDAVKPVLLKMLEQD
ncbi:hypothetical protein EOL96_06670 [Candidatus Saccharibacteria bacterium]|nr:hypothetical protein [Candidatus Saccharibacteria bacterium]